MGDIARISSNAPWEPIFGYSRAVKAGGWLAVSGTTGFDENGRIEGRNQMYVQARRAIANIAVALERSWMTLADVVRTRVFVTDMQRFPEVARAHRESFGKTPPASTVVEIRRLVNPDMMVEIEADAFAGSDASRTVKSTKSKVKAKPRAAGKPQAFKSRAVESSPKPKPSKKTAATASRKPAAKRR